MSGFAVHFARGGPADAAAVQRALGASPHRGGSIETAALGSCAVGIVRIGAGDRASLAIASDLVVALAGTIDNLVELRDALHRAQGHVEDESPAGAFLAAYRLHGEGLLRTLRGAFAGAVTDGSSVRCFRDHLGTGTVFYRDAGDELWLASEAKQVVAGARVASEPDLAVLEALFYGYREDEMPTALKGVARLPKASLIESDARGTRIRRYWDPTGLVERGGIPTSELKATFDRLMLQAVERSLRGDDIVALSGGIDSPTVAAFAAEVYARKYQRPLPALSLLFPDYPSADESSYIALSAERFGLELHTYQPRTGSQSLAALDEWTRLTDGPWLGWWEPAMDLERFGRLRDLGLRNLLTGDFAEFDMALPYHLVSHLMWKGRIRPLVDQLRAQRRSGTRLTKLARQVVSAFLPGAFFRAYRAMHRIFPVPEWLDPKRMTPTSPVERLSPWERWRHHQLAGFIGPGLPYEAYQIFCESQRITVRWPFADVDVWEFFLGLPAEVKFPGAQSKQLVRQFIRGRVPDGVVDRRVNTVIDEFVQRNFDLASLRYWVDQTDFRMPGVDYAKVHARLDRGSLQNYEYVSIKDLAQVHAFLSLWSGARASSPLPEAHALT